VIRRCLRARRDERYASAVELLDDLGRIDSVETGTGATHGLRWWQVHQLAIAVLHTVAAAALWPARHSFPVPWGAVVFYVALACATVSVTLRSNLWFTSRYQFSQLHRQRRRVAISLSVSELILDVLLVIAAATAASAERVVAPLLLVLAIVSLISLLVIEPATTRAAYRT